MLLCVARCGTCLGEYDVKVGASEVLAHHLAVFEQLRKLGAVEQGLRLARAVARKRKKELVECLHCTHRQWVVCGRTLGARAAPGRFPAPAIAQRTLAMTNSLHVSRYSQYLFRADLVGIVKLVA